MLPRSAAEVSRQGERQATRAKALELAVTCQHLARRLEVEVLDVRPQLGRDSLVFRRESHRIRCPSPASSGRAPICRLLPRQASPEQRQPPWQLARTA
jgi:hypothetical protein